MLTNILILALGVLLAVAFFGVVWSWMGLLFAPLNEAVEERLDRGLAAIDREHRT